MRLVCVVCMQYIALYTSMWYSCEILIAHCLFHSMTHRPTEEDQVPNELDLDWVQWVCVHCTLQCMSCGWPSPVQAVLVIGSSQHLLYLPRSLCGAVLGGLLCGLCREWGGGGRLMTQWESVVRKGRESVRAVVTADKLGISCVLPALTCWVEMCTDHTCSRPWVLLALQLMHNILTLYMCTDVGRPCFHMYNNHTVLNGVKLLQLLHVL